MNRKRFSRHSGHHRRHGLPTAEKIDCGRGRVEQRKCSVIADLSLIEKASEWALFQGLVRIESEREHKVSGKVEREIRFYITSPKPDAARLNSVIRRHWSIENKLHWALSVGFGEDLDRKRAGTFPQRLQGLRQTDYFGKVKSPRLRPNPATC